ncbi:hypothetical protein HOY80DRAFT_953617 [Tuber brumale]|nr:hypothetical protein HOY80DRAFT_953617 [Tuber brumale]
MMVSAGSTFLVWKSQAWACRIRNWFGRRNPGRAFVLHWCWPHYDVYGLCRSHPMGYSPGSSWYTVALLTVGPGRWRQHG